MNGHENAVKPAMFYAWQSIINLDYLSTRQAINSAQISMHTNRLLFNSGRLCSPIGDDVFFSVHLYSKRRCVRCNISMTPRNTLYLRIGSCYLGTIIAVTLVLDATLSIFSFINFGNKILASPCEEYRFDVRSLCVTQTFSKLPVIIAFCPLFW